MNPILLSVLIVSAIGLLAGLGLAVASIVKIGRASCRERV